MQDTLKDLGSTDIDDDEIVSVRLVRFSPSGHCSKGSAADIHSRQVLEIVLKLETDCARESFGYVSSSNCTARGERSE